MTSRTIGYQEKNPKQIRAPHRKPYAVTLRRTARRSLVGCRRPPPAAGMLAVVIVVNPIST
ncbi:hypothetical protein GCM10027612_28140 [Microbispora bryophytorum subsp. camponoti]